MNFRVKNVVPQLMSYQQFAKKNDLEEHLFIFLKHLSNDQNIYIYAKC